MKKILLAMAAVSALSLAAPSAAQYSGNHHSGTNIDARINELQARLQAGVQRGTITRQEAVTLREQLRQLRQLERQYSSDGLSRGERDQLLQRIQTLRQHIATAERNRDYRDRDDRWDDDDDDDDRYRRHCPPGLAKKNNGCLPPGQAKKMGDRYDNNYGAVPARYRDQFRDNQRYFYRYDNGRIYQIDRRSGTIVRVIDVRR